MTNKFELILDILCLDAIITLLFRRQIFTYTYIGYCRKTWLGEKLLRVLPSKISSKFVQCIAPFNEIRNDINMAVLRDVMVGDLMRKVYLPNQEKICEILNIEEYKLEDTYRVQTWDAYYHQAEAILRARELNIDVMCCEVLSFSREICGEVLTYKKRLDFTGIIPRINYRLDKSFDLMNRWAVIARALSLYLFAILLYPFICIFISAQKEKKDIAIDVTRRHMDIDSKSDLFWMNDSSFLGRSLLLEGLLCAKIGSAKKIPSIGFNPKLSFNSKTHFFLFNRTVCFNYIMSISCFIRLMFSLICKPQGELLIPALSKLFVFGAILNAYSTKVFVSNKAYFNSAPLLACAMQNVVYLRGTWSNQSGPHPHIATSSDVFFAWGDITVNTYSCSGARGTTFVKTGFIDGKIINKKEKIIIDNASFEKSNEEFVLGFFDNASGYEHPNRVKDLRECFLMLRDLLRANDKLVVLYKPKSGDLTEIHRTGTFNDMAEYIDKKRFVLLSGIRNYSNRPAGIAGEMDAVLGFPLSSAATETAISGVPSFHLDLTGTMEHPWELDNANKFIFHKTEDARNTLSSYINNPDLLRELSMNYLTGVNYFDDLLAKERMQSYIEFLCYNDESSVFERVSCASSRYINKFCKNDNCINQQSI